MTEGYISGGVVDGTTILPTVIAVNNNGVTYVVSADAPTLSLPADANISDAARPLLKVGENGGVGPIRLEPFGRHTWAPSLGE